MSQAASLKTQIPDITAKLERCEKKNRALRSIGGGVDTTLLEARWEEFQDRLERFESQAKEMKEGLRARMAQEQESAVREIEKFASRWTTLRPKAEDGMPVAEVRANAKKMAEWTTEWQALKDTVQQLALDCQEFEVPPPDMGSFASLETELDSAVASWETLTSFLDQLDEFGKEN